VYSDSSGQRVQWTPFKKKKCLGLVCLGLVECSQYYLAYACILNVNIKEKLKLKLEMLPRQLRELIAS